MVEKPTYEELEIRVKELEAISAVPKQEEEERLLLSEIITNMVEGVYLIRLDDGIIVYTNPKFEKMFGYGPDEMIGKHVSIVNAPTMKAPEETVEEILGVLRKKGEWHGEVHNIKKDGTPFWCYANVSTFHHSKHGEVLVSVHEDISERKQAEEALLKSEAFLNAIVDNIPDMIFIKDAKELQFVLFNKAGEELLGYSREELIGKNDFDFFPEEEASFFTGKDREVLESGNLLDIPKEQILTKYKGERILHTKKIPLLDEEGKPQYLMGISEDITARKQAEEALRENEEKYRTLFADAGDALFIMEVGPGNRPWFIECNQRTLRLFGCKSNDIIGKNPAPFSPETQPDGKPSMEKIIGLTGLAMEGKTQDFQWLHHRYDNREPFWVEVNLTRLTLGGKPNYMQAVVRDITERKRAEEALRKSEEQLRAVFNAAENVSFLIAAATDEQGNDPKIIEFSPGSEKIFGYKRDEMLGKSVSILHSPENTRFSDMTRDMRNGKMGFSGEISLVRESGDKFPALLSTHPLLDEEGNMYAAVGVSIDISNQKQLEAQLRQMEKVEAIGTLAGGIAHEFNNALSGIFGNIEILKMDFPEDETIEKCTAPMMKSSQRMARLTAQLLAYAGGGKYREKIISLNDFIENTLPILQHSVDSEIRVETDLTSDVLNIKADVTQMQMVLSAAIKNASEAIDGRGKIRITTNAVAVDKVFAESHPELKTRSYVYIAIKDDGRGMDDETATKIFEPFFTTKFQGRGLGMAAAYGIVINHDGLIVVDSELGKGTEIRIYLPAVEVESKEPKEPKVEVSSGTGTILLIEDEQIVLDVTRALLEKLGYRVLEARTGKEAIDIAESFDGDIDLALLDIGLPDMDGGKVYPTIKKARPNLKVIVCSGYAFDGPAQAILDNGAQDFIQKPFSLSTLSEKLNEVFENK